MYNMEIMIKRSVVITLISRAIIVIIFYYFQMSF